MDTWVTCASCQLKHRLRPEGTCPRCAASLGGPGAEAPAAQAPAPAPEASAAAPATWAGLPPEPATDVAPEGVSLRLAGSALLAVALTNLLSLALVPALAKSSELPAFSTLAPSLFDLFIGGSLLAGNAKHLSWARLRVVLGGIVWPLLLGVQGNWFGVVLQLAVTGALALLLWEGGRVRRTVAISVLTLFIAFSAALTLALRSGSNPLPGLMMSLKGELEPMPAGLLEGRQFDYAMEPPGDDWRLRSAEVTTRDNPLADRWMLLPSSDVHLIIVAEKLEQGSEVDMFRFRSAVLQNMKQGAPGLRELPAGDSPLARSPWYIHATTTVEGQDLEFEVVLRQGRGAIYQLMAFGPAKGYARAQAELAQAIASFDPG